ncbi:uncharacterized protein V1518DRAFT_431793 [Limtongia smithiae]|uniref:uncharacterized protein n=1 Tax=Limtongia smithiae TaxID=1125753 RepID=UPI0034CDD7B1
MAGMIPRTAAAAAQLRRTSFVSATPVSAPAALAAVVARLAHTDARTDSRRKKKQQQQPPQQQSRQQKQQQRHQKYQQQRQPQQQEWGSTKLSPEWAAKHERWMNALTKFRNAPRETFTKTDKQLLAFREEVELSNLNLAWPLYLQLRDTKATDGSGDSLINPYDLLKLAQCAHQFSRVVTNLRTNVEVVQGIEPESMHSSSTMATNSLPVELHFAPEAAEKSLVASEELNWSNSQDVLAPILRTLFEDCVRLPDVPAMTYLHILSAFKERKLMLDAIAAWEYLYSHRKYVIKAGFLYSTIIEVYADPRAQAAMPAMTPEESAAARLHFCNEIFNDFLTTVRVPTRFPIVFLALVYARAHLGDVAGAIEIWSYFREHNAGEEVSKDHESRALAYLVWNRHDMNVALQYLNYASGQQLVLPIGTISTFLRNAVAHDIDVMSLFPAVMAQIGVDGGSTRSAASSASVRRHVLGAGTKIGTTVVGSTSSTGSTFIARRSSAEQRTIVDLVAFLDAFFAQHPDPTPAALAHLEHIVQVVSAPGAMCGGLPGPPTQFYNTLLSCTSKLWFARPDIFDSILAAARANGMRMSVVSYRIIIIAHAKSAAAAVASVAESDTTNATQTREERIAAARASVRKDWNELVALQLTFRDTVPEVWEKNIEHLAKATMLTFDAAFFAQQLEECKTVLSPAVYQHYKARAEIAAAQAAAAQTAYAPGMAGVAPGTTV